MKYTTFLFLALMVVLAQNTTQKCKICASCSNCSDEVRQDENIDSINDLIQ